MDELPYLDSLQNSYRSDTTKVGSKLYESVLPLSVKFMRAVGYFSSSCFVAAPNGFANFFARGGKFYLISSNQLYGSDIRAIVSGLIERAKWKRQYSESEFFGLYVNGKIDARDVLSWLVANDFFHLKIAQLKGHADKYIYHEKIGVSLRSNGEVVSWTGSANETLNGLTRNFERIDVFDESENPASKKRALDIFREFQDLWSNQTERLVVRDFAECLKSGDLVYLQIISPREEASANDRISDRIEEYVTMPLPPEIFRPPEGIELFEHQKIAIERWLSNRGSGVLEMATGSGKTITALSLASKLWDAMDRPLTILIIAPYIALVDQWIEVCRLYGLAPIKCAEGYKNWEDRLDTAITSSEMGSRKLLSICSTAATLQTDRFQKLVRRLGPNCLVIADEVHNYGSGVALDYFPVNAKFRVGLSATPERAYDRVGTEKIFKYFGEIVYRFTLKNALDNDILTHYQYHPVFVGLTDAELEIYLELTHDLAKYYTGDDNNPVSDAGMSLLIKRARLIGAAQMKIPVLYKLLAEYRNQSHILVYCGDGSVESDGSGDWVRQIEETVKVIGRDLKMTCASFTAETSPERRKFVLSEFERGTIQVVVAIRCLDEGIDIPGTKTAFILASSSNPRQFVQRRGRLLRKAPGKERAEIYDFFVDPPHSYFPLGSSDYSVMQRLYVSQIRRAKEFIDLADNGIQARKAFRDITNYYSLHTAWEKDDV